ncbi:signal transduction histidine kinase [Amorphus suaedae]
MAVWFGRSKKWTSSSSEGGRGWSNLLTVILTLTTLGLLASTAMLYWEQERSRQALAISVRTSGWVAYQAQLELVRSRSAIRVAVIAPSQEAMDNVGLRLAILRSRLPLLYGSEEGRLLPNIQQYRGLLEGYESLLDGYLDRETPTPGSPEAVDVLNGLYDELAPLSQTLQTVLQSAIAYNEEVYRREQMLAERSAFVPLALLAVSGGLLVVFLILQGARDRQRLMAMAAAEEEAASVRENLRALIEAMPAMIVVYDPNDLEVYFINAMGLALINPSSEHPDWQRFLAAAQTALPDRDELDTGWGSFSFPRDERSIVALRGSRRPITWEGRTLCLLALADTTQLRDAEYQIMQAAKLSTLGEMASAIAHEINQPLAVIRMAAANARRLLANGDTQALQTKLSRIDEQVERAKRIIDQVRSYGRKPSLRAERFALPRAIDLAISFVAEQYRLSSIHLLLDLDLSEDVMVDGEQTLFEQVIVNILLNARDAYEGTEIDADRRVVSVAAATDGIKIRITISDAAGGIAESIIKDLFEPFTTTKPDGKGTGLGLSLSRNIVRKMGGEVSVENIASGARFTIVLPVADGGVGERSAA